MTIFYAYNDKYSVSVSKTSRGYMYQVWRSGSVVETTDGFSSPDAAREHAIQFINWLESLK